MTKVKTKLRTKLSLTLHVPILFLARARNLILYFLFFPLYV